MIFIRYKYHIFIFFIFIDMSLENHNKDFTTLISTLVDPLIQDNLKKIQENITSKIEIIETQQQGLVKNLNLIMDEVLEKLLDKIDEKIIKIEKRVSEIDSKINNINLIPGPTGQRGEQGIQGIKGDRGKEGPNGIKGNVGEPGVQGIMGKEGPVGPTGNEGPRGIQGIQGIHGIKGNMGIIGEKGETGYVGEKGETGSVGEKGETGYVGEKGDRGKDFYIDAVNGTVIKNIIENENFKKYIIDIKEELLVNSNNRFNKINKSIDILESNTQKIYKQNANYYKPDSIINSPFPSTPTNIKMDTQLKRKKKILTHEQKKELENKRKYIMNDIDLMFKNYHNNKISYKEFIEKIGEFGDTEEDKLLFKTIDTNNDGFISITELKDFIDKKYINFFN